MANNLEATIREAYDAFGRGDLNGYLSACTPDFVFSIPGAGGIAGTYHGAAGLFELAQKAMTFSGGSFQEIVEDVLANEKHAVVLAEHRFTRDGKGREYRTAHVYEVRAGKLAYCYEQPRDPAAFAEAWGGSVSTLSAQA